jgi:methionyl-tRNA synthetase
VAWVWFDALPNYITAPGYGSDPERFARWWPADCHLVGKDIVRFHAVYWPAMLMAAGLEPPRRVTAHGWLLVGGEKMSKTRLNQVAPADLVADFGVDAVRYHFLRDIPLGPDGDFSWEGMVARYNSDLANNLGNLLARVSTLVANKASGIGPSSKVDSQMSAIADEVVATAMAAWKAVAPADALEATWRLIHAANSALETAEPWKADPGPAVDAVLGDALEVLRIVAILASPAMPDAAAEVWRRIGMEGSPAQARVPRDTAWGGYPGGLRVEKGAPLFPRKK